MSKDNKVDINELRHSSALQPASYGERMFKEAAYLGVGMPLIGYAISRFTGLSSPVARTMAFKEIPMSIAIGALVGYVEARATNLKIEEVKYTLDQKAAESKDCGCNKR